MTPYSVTIFYIRSRTLHANVSKNQHRASITQTTACVNYRA